MGLETGWNCHISLTPNGDMPGSEIPPSSPSHAGSLHDDLNQVSRDDPEGLLLLEEEGHSDLISFQPTDSDIPSFLEDCNRAKLPRGIHQVRPHLQNIDNVPLLVPLFTDCTPDSECYATPPPAGPGTISLERVEWLGLAGDPVGRCRVLCCGAGGVAPQRAVLPFVPCGFGLLLPDSCDSYCPQPCVR